LPFLHTNIPSSPRARAIDEQKRSVVYLNKIKDKIQAVKERQEETGKNLEKITPAILDKAFKGKLV